MSRSTIEFMVVSSDKGAHGREYGLSTPSSGKMSGIEP